MDASSLLPHLQKKNLAAMAVRWKSPLLRSHVSPLDGVPTRILNLIMLAASSLLINIRVGGVVHHAAEPDDAASHSCSMLHQRRLLSFRRHFDFLLTFLPSWAALSSNIFRYLLHVFSNLLLGGVKTSLSFATSYILFARTSSRLSSLDSPTGLSVMAHTRCPFPLTSDGRACFQFPCLSWQGSASLERRHQTFAHQVFHHNKKLFWERSSVVNFPCESTRRAQSSFLRFLHTWSGLLINWFDTSSTLAPFHS